MKKDEKMMKLPESTHRRLKLAAVTMRRKMGELGGAECVERWLDELERQSRAFPSVDG